MSRSPPILQSGTVVVALEDRIGAGDRPVLRRGSTGVIVKVPDDPEHAYRIRFADGVERSLLRREFSTLGKYQSGDSANVGDRLVEFDLQRYVILRCVVGSRAYGLDRDASDIDRRGVYLPPADLHWSLAGVPEQLENREREECFWEYEKFVRLALKANPNILEVLWTPLVEYANPVAERLLSSRSIFLSRLVYATYNGYVVSQFEKLARKLEQTGEIAKKPAMHLIRLLLSGIDVLRLGAVPVRVEHHREELLAIRDGTMAWPDIDAWRKRLHGEFERAFAATTLPDRPDYARADELLIEARRSMT